MYIILQFFCIYSVDRCQAILVIYGVIIFNTLLNGISKEKARSTSKSHSYLCKHTLLAGAQIGGVTIGYAMNVNDRVVIKNTGKASWKYDV